MSSCRISAHASRDVALAGKLLGVGAGGSVQEARSDPECTVPRHARGSSAI